MGDSMQLQEMIDRLKNVSDEAWGNYVLKRDILYRRIKKEEMNALIFESIDCGKSYGEKIKSNQKSVNIHELALNMGLKITEGETKPGAKRLTFAVFTTPNHITIMNTPLRKVANDIKFLNEEDQKIFSTGQLRNLLLAHEMFHFIEEKYKKEIYTKNKKILLWSLFGIKNTSTLRSLSEIAGMYFAKEMTGFPYSPMMLDVILFWPFDKLAATNLYQYIVEIDENIRNGVYHERT